MRMNQPKLINFPEVTHIIGKDQPQYRPLPAHVEPGQERRITFCWQLSWRNRLKVLLTGKVWHQVLTFHEPFQPQLLLVDKPAMK